MNSNSGIIIRKAIPADLSDVYRLICELENDIFEHDIFSGIYEENLKSKYCFYIVAETENKVVGFISLQIQQLLHHCGTVGEVQEFYIDKDYRGKGIGRQLMDEVKQYAAEHQLKGLEVTSNKRRTENVNVYESLGFKLTHNKFTI
ncbi:GNAT family N-acetyltransferase [Taibaiella lutea]|uniref:GNAT family N-acetyltransferase n=1 Tax=Taibaiella lutea TaxID=2608001 RepID=A0A5M6CGF2_9BACT|nr:GNAT family N-acetyltransferase [Taibaiella lutea]KAA5532515.1 GNAT family N-acetyltransferase [Taibaiella lutea]